MTREPTRPARWVGTVLAVPLAVGVLVWIGTRPDHADPVIGSWYVTAPDAPYPYHMFTFHADHTMTQANPDAGNQHTSDSDGAGTWHRHGARVTGVFAEATADRHTGTPLGTGRISFTLTVTGDQLTGRAEAHVYDVYGAHLRGPLATPLHGRRITPSAASLTAAVPATASQVDAVRPRRHVVVGRPLLVLPVHRAGDRAPLAA